MWDSVFSPCFNLRYGIYYSIYIPTFSCFKLLEPIQIIVPHEIECLLNTFLDLSHTNFTFPFQWKEILIRMCSTYNKNPESYKFWRPYLLTKLRAVLEPKYINKELIISIYHKLVVVTGTRILNVRVMIINNRFKNIHS